MLEAAEGTRRRRTDLAFAGALSALFLGLLFVYGPSDIEQYHHSHPAVRVFHRALLDGRYLFWTDAFGLGTPLPLGENLAFHPLLLLSQWFPLRWVLSLFWLTHLTAGAFFLLRLSRLAEIDTAVARVVAFGFVVSLPTANYAYTDDWPSVFLGWTMLPVLVFCLCRLAEAARGARAWRSGCILMLLLAFVVWNGHLGHLVALGATLVVFGALLSRGDLSTLARFTAAALGAACLAGERLFSVVSEALRFSPSLERLTFGALPPLAWLEQLYRPLNREILAPLLSGDLAAATDAYLTTMAWARLPFLGLAFFAAATWGTVSSLRAPTSAASGRLRQAIVVSFWIAVVASILPEEVYFKLPSATLLFRDPAILFGLLAAGVGLSDWRRRPTGGRSIVVWAIALQVVQIILAVLPAVLVAEQRRQGNVRFYAGDRRPELAAWVSSSIGESRRRTFLSPGVSELLLSERAHLADLGLLATGDLEPLGLLPLNGYFKSISMDTLHPSLSLHHGFVGSHARIVEDGTLFDLLAIDYLLALDSERALDLSGFVPTGPSLVLPGGRSLVLLRNPDAWPLANLYDPAAARWTPAARSWPPAPSRSRWPSCPAPGLLCRDLAPLAAMRLPTEVRSSGRDGRILLAMAPAGEERLVVLAGLYRPEWRARSGTGVALQTHQVAGALLGVSVPPGVSEVHLLYRPSARLVLLLLGAMTFLGCCGALALTRRLAGEAAAGGPAEAAGAGTAGG